MLKILKALAQGPLSTQEMLEYIEESTDKNYRKEMILKYINTMRVFGIDILKQNGKYCLNSSLEKIDFNKRDLSIIAFLSKYVDKINHDKLKNNIYESLQKIEKYFSKNTLELQKHRVRPYFPSKPLIINDDNIEKYEKFCKDELKINIFYKETTDLKPSVYLVAPIKVIYKKGNAILIAFDTKTNEYKEFLIENITDVEQLPQKYAQIMSGTVLFKLKNRLAKSYLLKKGETVLEFGDGFIIVSNKSEDKELLLKRLLRYFDQCEILYPLIYRDKMLEILNSMEKIYE